MDNNLKPIPPLRPFQRFVIQNFPFIEKDFQDLDSYGLWCKIVEYVKLIADSQNETIEDVNYLLNYFDNLDVTEEINNKLDEMAEDGTLLQLIKGYIDPIYQPFEERINNEVERLGSYTESSITNLTNMVTGAVSGTPQGVYDTAEDLTEDDPDHDNIYVVTADGKWYYYNTTDSEWQAGGVYQSSLGVIPYHNTNNLVDISTISVNKMLASSTSITDNVAYNTTDYIEVDAETDYTSFTPIRSYCWYNEGKTSLGYTRIDDFPETPKVLTSPANAKYIRFSYYNYANDVLFVEGDVETRVYNKYTKKQDEGYDLSQTNYDSIDDEIEKVLYKDGSINLVDPDRIVDGYYLANNGNLTPSASYRTTKLIKVKPSTTYYLGNRFRQLLFYTQYETPIEDSYINTWTDPETITTTASTYYIAFTVASTDSAVMLVESDEAIDYIPFSPRIDQRIGLTDRMKQELGTFTPSNVLKGKKLVACGDSFTEYTNSTFDDGIYSGKDKTWPYLIGLRNDMAVVNMAKSGSTMAVNSDALHMHFSDTKYTEIPSDADYIIIKYGINDGHTNIPIGTIDSTDNETFYGAWNVVMSYIIDHHPFAKIGIIVTNGLDVVSNAPDNSYYANAIKNIAIKYGIPTLNEWNDSNVPLLNRTGRTDVDQSIRDERNENFRISAVDTHENYQCQEYESTIIENFIRSL